MNTFEKIEQLHTDYTAVITSVREAQSTLRYLKDAVQRRIETDKEEAVEKIHRFEEQIADSSRPETVRRLAVGELEKLKQTTFTATDAEREAFLAEIEIMKTGESDLKELEKQMRTAIKEVEREIAAMRKETLGDSTLSLLPNWIVSEKSSFNRLCKEVHLDGQ